MQLLDGFFADTILAQFLVHSIKANLVEFVDSNRDVHNLVRCANHLCNAGEYLTVVDFDADTDAKATEHRIDNLHQLHLAEQRVTTHHIGIALIELAVTALLWTVGTPNRLNLIATERQCQFLAMLHHITGERNRQVISETLLAKLCSQMSRSTISEVFGRDAAQEVTAVQDFEKQLVALLAILSH